MQAVGALRAWDSRSHLTTCRQVTPLDQPKGTYPSGIGNPQRESQSFSLCRLTAIFRTLIPDATAHSASVFNAFRLTDITIRTNLYNTLMCLIAISCRVLIYPAAHLPITIILQPREQRAVSRFLLWSGSPEKRYAYAAGGPA
jgi:hypothetical protein